MISVCDRVGNPQGRGENADYLHFLHFLQCFHKISLSGSKDCNVSDLQSPSNTSTVTVNPFQNKPWFLCVCRTSLGNNVGKGEIAHN